VRLVVVGEVGIVVVEMGEKVVVVGMIVVELVRGCRFGS
jgi:hypothetical protein